jgi:hypothetical protein
MNSRDEQHPSDEIPSGHGEADARPGVYAGKDAALLVNGLHQAHGLFAIHLRESSDGARIVQIQRFNAPAAIHAAQARNAGAAKAASTIE